MTSDEPDAETYDAQFTTSWIDLVESRAHLRGDYDPLITFVFEHIPEGLREVPDFRIPQAIQREWRTRKYERLRALLHSWRMEHDEEYRVYHMTNEARRTTRKAKEGWYKLARQAEGLRDKLEAEEDTPPEILYALSSMINILWDGSAKATDKDKAVKQFGQLRGLYEAKRPTETKAMKLSKMTSLDLIEQAMAEAADDDADALTE